MSSRSATYPRSSLTNGVPTTGARQSCGRLTAHGHAVVAAGLDGGQRKVVNRHGVAALSKDLGRTGDTIVVTPAKSFENDWEITLEHLQG